MIEVVVLLKNTTLNALSEHSVKMNGPVVRVGETESLVALDAQVVQALLVKARPEDTRLDDVILRLAL
jgi:hypothetical protein